MILIDEVVAIIIDTIADLNLAVRDTQITITSITDSVSIRVFLSAVEYLGAVVTSITNSVLVFVELIGVGYIWAVIFLAAEAIVI